GYSCRTGRSNGRTANVTPPTGCGEASACRIGDNGGVTDAMPLDPSDPSRRRMMAVHAHPDDESSKGAATMARYVDEGADVLVVTCTGGERGSILNPALKDRKDIEDNISEIRREEMNRAREILGVRQHWLGFVD